MSFGYSLKTLVPDPILSTREESMFCSGCFAKVSKYEMIMCKTCRRIYCRKCTGVDMASKFIETQVSRCVICRKRIPHPEEVLGFALLVYGSHEFIGRVRKSSTDASMDSVEDLLRRVCEERKVSYQDLRYAYHDWCQTVVQDECSFSTRVETNDTEGTSIATS